MQNYQILVPKNSFSSFLTFALKKQFRKFSRQSSLAMHRFPTLRQIYFYVLQATYIHSGKKNTICILCIFVLTYNMLLRVEIDTCRAMQCNALSLHWKSLYENKIPDNKLPFFLLSLLFFRNGKRREKKIVYFSRLYQLYHSQPFFNAFGKLIKN